MSELFGWSRTSLERAIREALRNVGKETVDLLEQPTRQWMPEHRPQFVVTDPEQEGDSLTCVAGVDTGGSWWNASKPFKRGEGNDPPGSVIYRWVSRGTKPHTIVPVEAWQLRYWITYIPSTSPHDWKSGRSRNTETAEVVRMSTQHPGIQPRDFEGRAAHAMAPRLEEVLQDAIARHVQAGNLMGPTPKQGAPVQISMIGALSRPRRRR